VKTFISPDEMYLYVKEVKRQGKEIALVPTMGYLHEGHLSLIKAARKECDVVITSIFVNPMQFGEGEDYQEYPRDLSRDSALAEKAGADIIFAPPVSQMYPKGYHTFVNVEYLTEHLCGSSRPGHFKGVATVVLKLFHIVQPDRAYFGQKDAQQVTVIEQMVKDLNVPVKIVRVPIVREQDGLAMSSRNVYLNEKERKQAPILFQSLKKAEQLVLQGEKNAQQIKKYISEHISQAPLAQIDYVEIVDGSTIQPIETLAGKVLIALAVRFGKTRLIDNIILEV